MTAKKAPAKKAAATKEPDERPAVRISNAQRAGGPQYPAQPGVPPPENT